MQRIASGNSDGRLVLPLKEGIAIRQSQAGDHVDVGTGNLREAADGTDECGDDGTDELAHRRTSSTSGFLGYLVGQETALSQYRSSPAIDITSYGCHPNSAASRLD